MFFAEYERRVLRGAGVEVSQEQAWQIWRRIRKIDYGLALFDDTIPALNACRQMGLTVGLISNMNQSGDELADSMGLLPYIDLSITSHEVGAEKPNQLIFERALERAGARPERAVHVGDQITSDIAGAVNAGINAVLLDRDGNHKGYTAQPRITGLEELPALLERFQS
ncbi:Glyceraldehyde 3-phosphate phosphatase [Geodia barretti]|jgi:putative hydrolase of the HAD superfamily|uniref:Glyceraldehyde 3-phosphate phosphatase n=1 Tax=Geodia barretti TaxID=519541 RepID=A0AA35RAF5_GEOBA|nr:Glyceraldehyde 3-phosphate phosphatase [Geodia barretti]